MIFGTIHVDEKSVSTHRDSYLLANLSVVSVRRPFLPAAILIGGGLAVFTISFADLLYAHELLLLVAFLIAASLAGIQLGQLKLLSRDLKGSELSGAIWGQYDQLNQIRLQITDALGRQKVEHSL